MKRKQRLINKNQIDWAQAHRRKAWPTLQGHVKFEEIMDGVSDGAWLVYYDKERFRIRNEKETVN